MINYSIVMRSVNANLLEINQAKSRINQAKKEGKTPDPQALELVKTEKICVHATQDVYKRQSIFRAVSRLGFRVPSEKNCYVCLLYTST